MKWYRVTVEAVDDDGNSVRDRFTVEAASEANALLEAEYAAKDCGWDEITTGAAFEVRS